MTTVVDTPEGIAFFQLLSIKGRLKLEIDSGIKFSCGVSTLAAVNRLYGQNFKTKKKALAYVEEQIKEIQDGR